MSTTVREWQQQIQEQLQSWHCAEAAQEANWIVQHLTGYNRLQLTLYAEADVPAELPGQAEAILARRRRREPLQYILGYQHFMDLKLMVNPAVLIPRPETEELAQLALQLTPMQANWQVADMGCGSGAIGITLASKRPHCRVYCTDISASALEVARENARQYGLEKQMAFWQGDRLEPLQQHKIRLHLFISNPPYVTREEYAGLSPEVRDFEPRLALVPEAEPLAFYRYLAEHLPEYLHPGAIVLLELNAALAHATVALFQQSGAFHSIRLHRDLQGLERVLETYTYGHLP